MLDGYIGLFFRFNDCIVFSWRLNGCLCCMPNCWLIFRLYGCLEFFIRLNDCIVFCGRLNGCLCCLPNG